MIITASFDHYVVTWDFDALDLRVKEKQMMREEDIRSRKIEVYNRALKAGSKGAKKTTSSGAAKKAKNKKK